MLQRTATTPVVSDAVPLMVIDESNVETILEPGQLMASAGGVRSGFPGAGWGAAGGEGGCGAGVGVGGEAGEAGGVAGGCGGVAGGAGGSDVVERTPYNDWITAISSAVSPVTKW